jgi:hypothetical protein
MAWACYGKYEAIVLYFVDTECLIWNSHSPMVQRLCQKFHSTGIECRAVIRVRAYLCGNP